jgi:hypothetical protein
LFPRPWPGKQRSSAFLVAKSSAYLLPKNLYSYLRKTLYSYLPITTGRVSGNNLVRVDFGDGVKSSWNKVNVVKGKKIIFVAQTNIDLDAYLFFRNRKYKVLSSGIELVK